MKLFGAQLFILTCFFLSAADAQTKRQVIKYRSHTDLDFSEQTVQGKIRSPDVFYIFQRKRSEGPQIVHPPERLDSLRKETRQALEKTL